MKDIEETTEGMREQVPVPEEVVRAISEARRVVAVAHVKPDGDAFGSALGLAGALRDAGKNAIAAGFSDVPDMYKFLDALAWSIPGEEYSPEDGDLVVVCDCSSLDRVVASMRKHAEGGSAICIDHHKTYTGFARAAYIDPNASSASELVCRVIAAGGWQSTMSRATAEAIWVGIMTDTGRFAYSSTAPSTFRWAADLLERCGARTDYLNEMVYGSTPLRRLKLQARAIGLIRVECDGELAWLALPARAYKECDAGPDDSENFVDIPRAIPGVKIAAFFYQAKGYDPPRLSLRTKPPYDAAEFCKAHGGGGHARAAGMTLNAPMEQSAAKIVGELKQLIANTRK